jgi:hypothetical protein
MSSPVPRDFTKPRSKAAVLRPEDHSLAVGFRPPKAAVFADVYRVVPGLARHSGQNAKADRRSWMAMRAFLDEIFAE